MVPIWFFILVACFIGWIVSVAFVRHQLADEGTSDFMGIGLMFRVFATLGTTLAWLVILFASLFVWRCFA